MKTKYILLIILIFGLNFISYSQELQPTESKVLVKVLYLDKETDIPEPNTMIRLIDVQTNQKLAFKTDSAGRYDLLLLKGKKYKVQVEFMGKYEEYDNLLEIPTAEGRMMMNFNMGKPVMIYKETYTLNVQYEFNKADLNPNSFPILDEYADTMKSHPNMIVEIAGHTDNVGSDDYNLRLSQRRAESVRQYLLKKGIKPHRIIAKGYGERQPLVSNDTEEERGRNRRTEVRVIEK